jgi:hypothetical protein
MQTATQTSTSHAILEVEWDQSTDTKFAGMDLERMMSHLERLDGIMEVANTIAKGFFLDSPASERARAGAFSPSLRRLRFESPLVIELGVIREIAEGVGALAFLVFALKRTWGIDLELKAHREAMRLRFVEAKQKADAAEATVEAVQKEAISGHPFRYDEALVDATYKAIDYDLDWGKEATKHGNVRDPRWGDARGTIYDHERIE